VEPYHCIICNDRNTSLTAVDTMGKEIIVKNCANLQNLEFAARKYFNSSKCNFDIFLPNWIERYNN
ncbi:hypothetical protein LCGC14_1523830, partial [marine sediment metagenome]